MSNSDQRSEGFLGWARESSGYLKDCRDCGRRIYLKLDSDGKWRPYSSWVEGDAAEGEWKVHHCVSAATEANTISALSKIEMETLHARIRRAVSEVIENFLRSKR